MDMNKGFKTFKIFAALLVVDQLAIYGAIGYGIYSLAIYAIDAFSK